AVYSLRYEIPCIRIRYRHMYINHRFFPHGGSKGALPRLIVRVVGIYYSIYFTSFRTYTLQPMNSTDTLFSSFSSPALCCVLCMYMYVSEILSSYPKHQTSNTCFLCNVEGFL